MSFKKAERKLAKLRLGICGPSGSGKTWSSLLLATGISNKIALLDTERRGHLYAKDFDFDIEELDAPYSPDRYIERIRAAEKEGYEVLIIDSLSHAWVGEGGVLSIVDKASSNGGNNFTNGWKTATPKQNALVDTIITCKMHVIVTMRSKTEYVLEPNHNGKMAPRKLGLAPVQRDGLEYEFTMFMDMNEKIAHVTKDNTNLYNHEYIQPSVAMGENILTWLLDGRTKEEIYAEEEFERKVINDKLIDAEDILKKAVDYNQLKSAYKEVVTKYPTLENNIIPIAAKIKESFQFQDIAL